MEEGEGEDEVEAEDREESGKIETNLRMTSMPLSLFAFTFSSVVENEELANVTHGMHRGLYSEASNIMLLA